MRSPVELDVHYKVLFLMKVTLFLDVLYGLLAGSSDQNAKWPYFRYFSVSVPCARLSFWIFILFMLSVSPP